MADLVTHTCVVLLPAVAARWRWAGVCALGAALPDLGGRVVPIGLAVVHARVVPVPEVLVWPWVALHEPVGVTLVAALLAQLFVERQAAFGVLLLGVASHLALDLLQFHHGRGYALAAPFSTARFELGWIDSEATVPLAMPLLAATAAVAAWRWWEHRRARQAV